VVRKGRKKREERGLDRIGFYFGLGCQFRAERGRREKGERDEDRSGTTQGKFRAF